MNGHDDYIALLLSSFTIHRVAYWRHWVCMLRSELWGFV